MREASRLKAFRLRAGAVWGTGDMPSYTPTLTTSQTTPSVTGLITTHKYENIR